MSNTLLAYAAANATYGKCYQAVQEIAEDGERNRTQHTDAYTNTMEGARAALDAAEAALRAAQAALTEADYDELKKYRRGVREWAKHNA